VGDGPAQVRGVAARQGSPTMARRICLTGSCNISAANEMSTHQNYSNPCFLVGHIFET
jgi:hypothetical protein